MYRDRLLSEVLTDLSDIVVGDASAQDVLHRLASGALRVLGVDAVGVMVPSAGGLLRFSFAVGPDAHRATALEQLQEHLQAGPCHDSHASGRVINVADLATEGDWPRFQALAVRAGLRAVTAIPLTARGQRWGVLDLYRVDARRLDVDDLAVAQTLAALATSFLVVAADRDTAQRAQQELAYRAMHDPLTELPVRWVFLRQLGHAVTGLARHPGQVGVLFVDIDGLKYVNDTYGHEAGDTLLLTCVQRIRAALRPTDVVARLGGDEFVVLLENLAHVDDAEAIARRILSELAHPPHHHSDGDVVQPSASIGLALTDDPDMEPAVLIAHADSAMYRAKRAGRGRYSRYDIDSYKADRSEAVNQRRIGNELRTALRDHQFRLHYQPIFQLTGHGPRRQRDHDNQVEENHSKFPDVAVGPVRALEALIRWQHPQRGLLTAHEFVPHAERAGLMPDIGAWVLSTACEQLATWDHRLGARAPARLFVNVSAEELTANGFLRHLTTALQQSGTAPARLTLELTETGLIDDTSAAARAVNGLRELGCELAIDDFGTGYSSLSRLIDVPAGTWKIDRSFTKDLSQPSAAAVVSAVLQLGQRLHRTVVVEGVEDAATLHALHRLGCTHVQGYHLGRPQPASSIPGLLLEAPTPTVSNHRECTADDPCNE